MPQIDYNLELNKLFDEWENASQLAGYKNFCRDGLMYKGINWTKENDGKIYYGRYSGNENELWSNSDRKIVFLMKDTNNNPNQDYREWLGRQNESEIKHKFFKNIALWLFGILNTNINGNFPKFEDAFNIEFLTKIFDEKPFAIINCKKESGKGSIHNYALINYINNFGIYLKKQIEILNPNIIVCGGSGVVINIAKEIIYPEYKFEKINSWIHFNKQIKVILIDSYHPSARISYEKNYIGMMEAYGDFLTRNN